MSVRGMLAAGAGLLAAWGAWTASGWIVAAFGPPFAALLLQAVLFILALMLAERVLARFAPTGDPHG
jgi:hypothetical protein